MPGRRVARVVNHAGLMRRSNESRGAVPFPVHEACLPGVAGQVNPIGERDGGGPRVLRAANQDTDVHGIEKVLPEHDVHRPRLLGCSSWALCTVLRREVVRIKT